MKKKPGEAETDEELPEELTDEPHQDEEDEQELEEETDEEETPETRPLPPSRPSLPEKSRHDASDLHRLYQMMIQNQQAMNQMLDLQQKRIEQIAQNQAATLTSLDQELRAQVGHRQKGEAIYEMFLEALAQQGQHLDRLQTTTAALIQHHRQDHQA